jgi:hypothetical protein
MKRSTTLVQNVRILVVATAFAGGAWGCGGGGNDTGGGGTSGGAGTTGAAGTSGAPCDAMPLFALEDDKTNPHGRSCTIDGACHDSKGSAANFDMTTAGWQNRLVGKLPAGGGTLASMCKPGAGANTPYLVAGSSPATGLFLEKINANPPCGVRMPNLGSPFNATELACVQSWANGLVAAAAK